ncbi:unnamed protein product, partial [Ectocarpus sp. 13 AM-2016]
GDRIRTDDPLGRRHGTRHGDESDHLHPAPLSHEDDAPIHGRYPDELRLHGQGEHLQAGGAQRDRGGRCGGPQAARGLGHHPRRDRLLPHDRGGNGHSGHDSHRHAKRVVQPGGLRGCLQGPHHPHLPQRGGGRGARARHHRRLRGAECHPVLHEPDQTVYDQHHRRAPGHADGVSPPGQGGTRRRSLRREPYQG